MYGNDLGMLLLICPMDDMFLGYSSDATGVSTLILIPPMPIQYTCVSVCVRACVCVCVCVCFANTDACNYDDYMYAYIHTVCTYISMYVCNSMHVRMYVNTPTLTILSLNWYGRYYGSVIHRWQKGWRYGAAAPPDF